MTNLKRKIGKYFFEKNISKTKCGKGKSFKV